MIGKPLFLSSNRHSTLLTVGVFETGNLIFLAFMAGVWGGELGRARTRCAREEGGKLSSYFLAGAFHAGSFFFDANLKSYKQHWKRRRQVSEQCDPSWVSLIVVNLHYLKVLCRSDTEKWKDLFTLIKIPWNAWLNLYISFRNFATCATKRRHSPFCPCTNEFRCCIGKLVIFLAFLKTIIFIVIKLSCMWEIVCWVFWGLYHWFCMI